VFVDSSAFVAVAMRRDDQHNRALRVWHQLEKDNVGLVTSDWVFGETVSFVRRREGYATARAVGEALWNSRRLERLTATPRDVERAWEAFVGYAFDDLSLVDCLSFVLARAHRIRSVFTFDQHFAQAGFQLLG
jgi:predicted nucleic acid-binding protein